MYLKKLFKDYTGNLTDQKAKRFKKSFVQRFNLPTFSKDHPQKKYKKGDIKLDDISPGIYINAINYLQDIIRDYEQNKKIAEDDMENLDFTHIDPESKP